MMFVRVKKNGEVLQVYRESGEPAGIFYQTLIGRIPLPASTGRALPGFELPSSENH